MNLAWHIAAKDLRRFRVPIYLWVVLIAAKLGLGAVLIWGGIGGKASSFNAIADGSRGLAFLECLVAYFLVAAFVHEDPLVGTQAFWMTRPVNGVRLLAGKLTGFAVVFGIVPLLVTLPWWLACGYGPEAVGMAAVETLVWQGTIVCLALPLAALTDGLARYLIGTLILVAIIGQLGTTSPAISPPVQGATPFQAISILIAGFGAAAVCHFCTRRRFFTIGLMAMTTVFAIGAVILPWRSDDEAQSPTLAPGRYGREIAVTFAGAQASERARTNVQISVGLQVTGVPRELVLHGTAVHGWTWSGGATLVRVGEVARVGPDASWLALGLKPLRERPDFVARAMASVKPRGSTLPAEQTSAEAYVSGAFLKRVQSEPPAYLARLQLQLMRPVVLGERPVRMGETIAGDSEVTRISEVYFQYHYTFTRGAMTMSVLPPKPQVDPVTHQPVEPTRRLVLLLAEHQPKFFLSRNQPYREYFLVNRRNGDAAWKDGTSRTRPVCVATVAISWRALNFVAPRVHREEDDSWIEQPNWFDNLTLAKIKFREEERFTKDVRTDRFEIALNSGERRTP